MTIEQPVRFKGVPGSPYTRKMLAYLRYRHIRYELLIGNQAASLGLPEPKVALLPTFYLRNASGELEAAGITTRTSRLQPRSCRVGRLCRHPRHSSQR